MIIKIWRYEYGKDRPRRPRTRQSDGFDIAFGCTSYIFGVLASEVQKEAFENSDVIGEGIPDAVRAGDYVVKDDGVHEILGRAGHNLGTDKIDEQIKKMSVLTAAAGLEHFYHYTWSHRPGVNLSAQQIEKQNRTMRHVLEAEDCPCVEATHGERNHRHGHGILLSVDGQGKGKPLEQTVLLFSGARLSAHVKVRNTVFCKEASHPSRRIRTKNVHPASDLSRREKFFGF